MMYIKKEKPCKSLIKIFHFNELKDLIDNVKFHHVEQIRLQILNTKKKRNERCVRLKIKFDVTYVHHYISG